MRNWTNRLLWVLWLSAMIATAVAALQVTSGSGFTRGLDRVASVLVFQAVATVIAFTLWRRGKRLRKGSLGRWLSVIPALVAVGLGLFALGLIAQALLF